MAAGADRPATNPGTPLWSARAGTLMLVARNRIRFIEIAIHFRQSRPDSPLPGNGPFFLKRQYPAEIYDRGRCYDL